MPRSVDKATVRRELRARRRALSREEAQAKSQRILARLLALEEYQRAQWLHTYISSKDQEVDTWGLARAALRAVKHVVVPVVKSGGTLAHVEIQGVEELNQSRLGIWEPPLVGARLVAPEVLDLVVVPGIAFDREGWRIGFGQGYYDRFLRQVEAPKVGLAYAFQVVETLPRSSKDIPVDLVVTEAGILRCRLKT